MSSHTLNVLHTFDNCDFAGWDTTACHVISATGYYMALNSRPLLVLVNSIKTNESIRAQDNWDDAKPYGNLMLCSFSDIRNLAIKVQMQNTNRLLDWLKIQYGTTSILATYTDAITISKLSVSGDCNPTSIIDRLLALFTHLEDNKFIHANPVQAMTLLLKLPLQIKKIVHN